MDIVVKLCLVFFITLRHESLGNPVPLVTRQVTNFGIWSQEEYCPWGTYIVGMSLKRDVPSSSSTDQLGLTGVKFFCSPGPWRHISSRMQSIVPNAIKLNNIAEITSGHYPVGTYGKDYMCNGIALGVQFRAESYQGPFGDDTGINNVRLECYDNIRVVKYWVEGDGTDFGSWRAKYSCPLGKALCGVETQVDMAPHSDGVGLNNANMYCCSPAIINDEGDNNDTEIVKESIKSHNQWHQSNEYSNGIYLETKPVKSLPKHTEAYWNEREYCPIGSPITGMGILKYEVVDDEVIGGIGFICQKGSESTWINSGVVDSEVETSGGDFVTCPSKHFAVGIVPFLNPGPYNFDKFHLICENLTSPVRVDIQNVTWPESHYTYLEMERLECPAKHFICGIRGQFLEGAAENEDVHLDLKNFEIKCCARTATNARQFRMQKHNSQASPKKIYSSGDRDVYNIVTPGNTNSGIGTPWQLCGPKSHITGKLSILHGFSGVGLNGIHMPCSNTPAKTLQVATERFTDQDYKDVGNSCPGNEVVGIQVKIRPTYGNNNTANFEIMDLRLYCDDHGYFIGTPPINENIIEGSQDGYGFGSIDIFAGIFAEEEITTLDPLDKMLNNSLIQDGIWAPIQYCQRDEVVCGVRAILKGSYMSNLHFECCENSVGLNISETNYGMMLSNKNSPGIPLISTQHNGPQQWSSFDYCSDHNFVSGFQAKRDSSMITGLQLLCTNPTEEGAQLQVNTAESIGVLEFPMGNYSKPIFCPNGGVAIGYDVELENDTITNFKLYCSWSEGKQKNYVFDSRKEWSTSTNSLSQHCPQAHALCGLQTGFPSTPNANFLSGINVKCCKVPHPASACTPQNTWEIIGGVDNRNATTQTAYNYNRRTGITQTHTRNQNLLREKTFAANVGYNTDISSVNENSTTNSEGRESGSTGSRTGQSSTEINISQALAGTMTSGSSTDTGSSFTSSHDSRDSRSSQVSNSRTVERSKSSSEGHSAGVSAGFSGFGVSVSASYNYNHNTESRNSESNTVGQTSGSEQTVSQSVSKTNTQNESIRKDTTLANTQTWGNSQSRGETDTTGSSVSNNNNSVVGILGRLSQSDSKSGSQNRGDTERIEWSTSDSRVWTKEVSETIDLAIPPGVRVSIYQAVGKCSFYEVRSPLVKREDVY